MSTYLCFFFFFNDTATTEIYTLSLHDALPISCATASRSTRSRPCASTTSPRSRWPRFERRPGDHLRQLPRRSEEHTSELQSRQYLVCRLLLEKKKKTNTNVNRHKICINNTRSI